MDQQTPDDTQQKRDDQLLASAVTFLLDGGDEKAAMILLPCSLTYQEFAAYDVGIGEYTARELTLMAPRLSYDVLSLLNRPPTKHATLSESAEICTSIKRALLALTHDAVRLIVKASIVQVTAQWREELLARLRGETVTNQGLPFFPQRPGLTWNNLRFRSASEVRIAEALEREQVLFLPNCLARLGFSHRENREADFLICHKGKWGIIEVDGPLAHPPARKADDDERARLFKAHGIRLLEHFDAGNCLENADGIVKRFLYLLGQ
jgi:hypothetical protein